MESTEVASVSSSFSAGFVNRHTDEKMTANTEMISTHAAGFFIISAHFTSHP
ncbi:hypothetical protein UF75_5358 [Desulfosporosinus sp. I2]|nr:hypothetical protein UF75_5358 [Desulfosporosinus sp. I2]